MSEKIWKLAKLTDQQLGKIKEAEQALGPVNLLAFQSVELQPAVLKPSQIEHLQNLEKTLGFAVVAYEKK
jgi:hypothetical protein